MFSVAYGHEKDHAEALGRGLSSLPSNFVAEVCPLCKGEGARKQWFNAGCGGGMFETYAGCDYCDGSGLVVGGKPAPVSVLAQVLKASS